MQSRRSLGDPSRLSVGSAGHYRGDREGLIRAYDEEEGMGFGLADLAEESEDDAPLGNGSARRKTNGHANGNGKNLASITVDSRLGGRSSRSPTPTLRSPTARSPTIRSPTLR
jgi:hypothetical protein